MNSSRIQRIRDEEKTYHEICYQYYTLFEQGSWLYKPVKTVMDLLFDFEEKGNKLFCR